VRPEARLALPETCQHQRGVARPHRGVESVVFSSASISPTLLFSSEMATLPFSSGFSRRLDENTRKHNPVIFKPIAPKNNTFRNTGCGKTDLNNSDNKIIPTPVEMRVNPKLQRKPFSRKTFTRKTIFNKIPIAKNARKKAWLPPAQSTNSATRIKNIPVKRKILFIFILRKNWIFMDFEEMEIRFLRDKKHP
jgi:hypothetical protein